MKHYHPIEIDEVKIGEKWRQARLTFSKWSKPDFDSSQYWDDRYRVQWLDLMLPRIRDYSTLHAASVEVPNPAYHGSPYPGIKELDPTIGQGLGTWFQRNLVHAARFAIDRNYIFNHQSPDDSKILSHKPVVYQAVLNAQNTAIFPKEIDSYRMAIPKPDDNKDLNLWRTLGLDEVRELLSSEGYDSIYLQDAKTISAIDPKIITLQGEHPALPIFNEHLKPKLERDMGPEGYNMVYGYLHKLSL